MDTLDKLLEASPHSDLHQMALDGFNNKNNCMDVFKAVEEEAHWIPLVDPPAAVTVRGDALVSWRLYRVTFVELCDILAKTTDKKKFDALRVVEQVTGVTASGMEVVLTRKDVLAMSVPMARYLVLYTKLLGDMPTSGTPALLNDGNAISKPLTVRLGQPIDGIAELGFMARTMGELELVCSGGDLYSRAHSLMEIESSGNGYILQQLTPMDGWFLLNSVLEKITKDGTKVLTAIRSYEYTMRLAFPADTPLSVVRSRQADYAEMHKAANKARTKK